MFDICGNNLTIIKMIVISPKFIGNIGIFFSFFFLFHVVPTNGYHRGEKNKAFQKMKCHLEHTFHFFEMPQCLWGINFAW